jgi:hypothetical protein
MNEPSTPVKVLEAPSAPKHTKFTRIPEGTIATAEHRFESYRFEISHLECCNQIRDACTVAWHLTAPVYLTRVPETGFQGSALGPALTPFGVSNIPVLAHPDDITHDPVFTDLTEILALEVFHETEPGVIVPVPRVFRKESKNLQHHGIDLLGYACSVDGDYTLFVIEVMASDSSDHPPSTVRDHRRQLLDQTLNEPTLDRLRIDLGYVHAAAEDRHKPVLNGFIAALVRDRSSFTGSVVAGAVLVRPAGLLGPADSKPFHESIKAFESAIVPSRILFKGVDCGLGFVEFFTAVAGSLVRGVSGS